MRVESVQDRSIFVDDDGQMVKVASSRAHSADLGLLVLSFGDLSSETSLLNPLAKSVLQFLRLLLPDDHVHAERLRTMAELQTFWPAHSGAYSHVILIGHGNGTAHKMVEPPLVPAADLADLMAGDSARRRLFLSLACETGRAGTAKTWSRSPGCASFIAPFGKLQGAAGSQFAQTFFAQLLLDGAAPKVAFNKSRKSGTGDVRFRYWRRGKLAAG